ncbi:MAG: non-ribosomal peptide synthetase, partial [Limisphaerales bacterium]
MSSTPQADNPTATLPPENSREMIAGLSREKRALLEKKLLERKSSTSPKPKKDHSTGPPRLSFSQESLWFMDQLEPKNPFYNIPQALRLRGELNSSALQKTLESIVQRHETLRTQFISQDGKPALRVAENKPFVLNTIDLSALTEMERKAQAEQLMEKEASRHFDLTADLMLRATLLKFSPREHILLLTVHHIASDLWSFSVLYAEVTAFYEKFSNGEIISLPELKTSFSQLAAQQRERFQGEVFQKQLAYWKQQLTGELPVLELLTDRPRPGRQTFKGGRCTLNFPPVLLAHLKEFSRHEGVTLYMTLLAAFQTLLHRYSNQENIIVGSPINGRLQPESEKLIGYFVNTVALRADFSGNPTFRQLLQQVRGIVLGAFENQEMPLEKLVEELKIPRHAGHNPLFQVIFQFLAAPPPPLVLPGITAEPLPMESGTAKFDLTFTLIESADGISGDLEYNSGLFDRTTIERMIGHFEILLEGIVATPDQRVENLPLLSHAERETILVHWNKTQTDYPRNNSISEIFEEQVARSPEAVALIFGQEKLTYRQLNERANQLAHHLRKKGVGRDVRVGLCLERSLEMIIGLLGILKAGGAYVPLDAHYPGERLAYMFEDTGARILITEKKFKHLAPQKTELICWDENETRELLFQESRANPTSLVTAENLAYVIYTSGSTGQPKGVSIPHRAVVRLVKKTNFMTFSSEAVFLQFAPISFD